MHQAFHVFTKTERLVNSNDAFQQSSKKKKKICKAKFTKLKPVSFFKIAKTSFTVKTKQNVMF